MYNLFNTLRIYCQTRSLSRINEIIIQLKDLHINSYVNLLIEIYKACPSLFIPTKTAHKYFIFQLYIIDKIISSIRYNFILNNINKYDTKIFYKYISKIEKKGITFNIYLSFYKCHILSPKGMMVCTSGNLYESPDLNDFLENINSDSPDRYNSPPIII